MKPITQNQLNKFVRYPKTSTKFQKPLPPSAPKPIPTPHLTESRGNNYRTNNYITKTIQKFNKSRTEVLAPSKPSTPNPKQELNTTPTGGNLQNREVPTTNRNSEYKPTNSDKTLLQYLLEMKYMSFDQINRKF